VQYAKSAGTLSNFIRRLFNWMRRTLGSPKFQAPGTLEGRSTRATLWRVVSTEPGVSACWWLCHQDATADLVINLINLVQLREDSGRGNLYRRSTDSVYVPGKQHFSAELEAYCQSQGGLDPRFLSHIFVVIWRSRVAVGDNRRYLVQPLAAIPGDLQGVTGAWSSGDRYAMRITEAIAKRLLRTQPTALVTWQEIVNKIDWLEWLEAYAKQGLGQSHVLQPRHSPKK